MGKRKLTIKEFIIKARQVHGDRYDYSAVEYVNAKIKVIIIYPKHGPFEQVPDSHFRGSICKKCSIENKKDNLSKFIVKAKRVHGDRYDYSRVEYFNAKTNVTIICPDHGPFEQKPSEHYRYGCYMCSGFKNNNKDFRPFFIKANNIHGDRYDYSLVEYKDNKTKVKIICKKHGVFEQRPNNHLLGEGCPICAKHVSNQELDFLSIVLDIYDGEVITNSRLIISPYEVDIYLPNKNMAFEYNGNFWHLEGVNKPIGYHQMKTDMCKDRGITLYHIWEDDWINNNDHIKGMIKELLL